MKATKKNSGSGSLNLGLSESFETLESEITRIIDTLDGIKPLKGTRKELKALRLAISAIERQVSLYEKNPLT